MRPIQPRSVIEPDRPPPVGRWVVLLVLVGVGWFLADRLWKGGTLEEIRREVETLAREAGGEAVAPAPGPPPVRPRAVDRETPRPMRVDGNVQRPRKIAGPNPQYTEMARKGRIQGVVILEAVIDRQGDVVDARVLKPLPMGLDQAALDAVRQWKFEPARLDGEPVDVYYNLTVNFRLQ